MGRRTGASPVPTRYSFVETSKNNDLSSVVLQHKISEKLNIR